MNFEIIKVKIPFFSLQDFPTLLNKISLSESDRHLIDTNDECSHLRVEKVVAKFLFKSKLKIERKYDICETASNNNRSEYDIDSSSWK